MFRIIFKNLKNAVGPVPKILTLQSSEGFGLAEDGRELSSEAALKISAVFCAVQYISDFVSSLPVYIFDRSHRQRVPEHHLNRLLSVRPNPFQTPSDYKRFQTRALLLKGNSYGFIVRDPKSGRPAELLPLHPCYVIIKVIDGEPWYFYREPTSGQLWKIRSMDIVHYKMDSDDGYYGTSVLRHASRTLRRASAADHYEQAIYTNNARPGGVLVTDADLGGYSDAKDPATGQALTRKENLRRAWAKAFGGGENAFRVAILDNGLKYQPIKMDLYDASFVLAKDVSISDIARFFGVPLHALMTGKQSYSSNEQNSLEFVQGRGLAIVRAMEEEDSYKLLLDSDLARRFWVKRNLDARLRGDTITRANFYRTMHDIGAYSVNDINALEDRPDVPGGDVRVARLDGVPLEYFEEIALARNFARGKEENN